MFSMFLLNETTQYIWRYNVMFYLQYIFSNNHTDTPNYAQHTHTHTHKLGIQCIGFLNYQTVSLDNKRGLLYIYIHNIKMYNIAQIVFLPSQVQLFLQW